MRYFHLPNFHFAIPSWFKIIKKPKMLLYDLKFNKNCKYNLDNLDQKDWNKLNGITNAVFGNAVYSKTLMLVWRYNVLTNKFEIGVYIHNYPEQERILPESIKAVYVLDGNCCSVRINLLDDKIIFQAHTSIFEIKKTLDFNYFVRVTNPWFGGNNPSPKFMHFETNFITQ